MDFSTRRSRALSPFHACLVLLSSPVLRFSFDLSLLCLIKLSGLTGLLLLSARVSVFGYVVVVPILMYALVGRFLSLSSSGPHRDYNHQTHYTVISSSTYKHRFTLFTATRGMLAQFQAAYTKSVSTGKCGDGRAGGT